MLFLVTFQAFLLLLFTTTTSISRKKPITTLDTRLPLVDNNHPGRFRMKSDTTKRVSISTRHLSSNKVWNFKTDLIQMKNEYYVKVDVGAPPQKQTLQIDTGSDYMWVQCQPCDDNKCYPQQDPVFNPIASTSFHNVDCYNEDYPTACDLVDDSVRGCHHSRCTYKIKYGDGSVTQGTMALESITIGGTAILSHLPIGCSHKTNGSLNKTNATGVLGLGGGPLSFVSQSSEMIGGMFSYCFDIVSGGWLSFGLKNVPNDIMWASLIHNPKNPTFYYIDLVNITVGGEVVHMGDSFKLNTKSGEGGVIIDTGTVVTWLHKDTYEDLRDKFKKRMSNHTLLKKFGVFDTCYNLSGVDLYELPITVNFTLLTHKDYNLISIILIAYYPNVLYTVDELKGKYCLAFAPTSSDLNIIGNFQQKGIPITIDTGDSEGRRIGFWQGSC